MPRHLVFVVVASLLCVDGALATDEVPPAAITDLTVTAGPRNATLTFHEVGDQCSNATCAQYVVAYADHTITNLNFGTQNVLGTAIPSTPGNQRCIDTDTIVLHALNCGGVTYHFAIKAKDLAGNWSAISNEVTLTTLPCDHAEETCK